MPFEHSIWVLEDDPVPLKLGRLESERELEDAIEKDPTILSDHWLIIGRQVQTEHGGKIDLLAIDPGGSIIVIELKRDQTPRDVVAQALDYAAWVESITPDRLLEVYRSYAQQRPGLPPTLGEALQARFGTGIPEEEEMSHQVVIVASSLDASSERIVSYLADSDVPLNVVFFQVFEHEGRKILSRGWFRDPGETQESAQRPRADDSWNGEFYASFGDDETRSWLDGRRYGYVSAGGDPWYTRTLRNLKVGARVWVCVPKRGYVGVGIVEAGPVLAHEFLVQSDSGDEISLDQAELDRPAVLDRSSGNEEQFVKIRWLHTVPLEGAIWEPGFFANQNTACAPTAPSWRFTVEQLARRFGQDR